MGAARERAEDLRSLATEEMKDRRQIATELIKNYITSGQPQSAAGKQARDEGLVPGTPEFQARVKEITEVDVDRKLAAINSILSNMSVAQANLALAQARSDRAQRAETMLTGPEMSLKTQTEDMLGQTATAFADLQRAFALNPRTLPGSLGGKAQYKLSSLLGSNDELTKNTGELINLLSAGALSQLKSTFPGAISNDERKALMDLQGVDAANLETRKAIMLRAGRALQSIQKRAQKRLDDINAGKYRMTERTMQLEDSSGQEAP